MKFYEDFITKKKEIVTKAVSVTWPESVHGLASYRHKKRCDKNFMEILSPELFYQIVLKLSVRDVSACMQVCKRWKKLLSSNYFWQHLTQESFNFNPVIKVSGILLELTGNWNYGWGPRHMSCPSEQALFLKTPSQCKSGVILPMDINLSKTCHDFHALFQAIHTLTRISNEVKENSIAFAGRGRSKGECPVDTCLFPWDHCVLPSKEKILEMFQINEQVVSKMLCTTSSEALGTHIELQDLFISRVTTWNPQSFCTLLSEAFKSYVELTVDYRGRTERYHPKVVFILTQLSPGWAGGILTGLW